MGCQFLSGEKTAGLEQRPLWRHIKKSLAELPTLKNSEMDALCIKRKRSPIRAAFAMIWILCSSAETQSDQTTETYYAIDR